MKPANPRILTINGGSSSIKLALFEARARFREAASLRSIESALTGESEAVTRQVATSEQSDIPLADCFLLLAAGAIPLCILEMVKAVRHARRQG